MDDSKKAHRLSGIVDNLTRGNMGDFLKEKIIDGSKLSFVSAYFTIYAFEALKEKLSCIKDMRFLFGEPRFLKSLDPEKTDRKVFNIEDHGLALQNRLQQKRIARECTDWIKSKVEIRSLKKLNLLHGKMYHIDNDGVEEAIVGSSNFTVSGLGLGSSRNNIELNLEVDSRRDRNDLIAWFEEIWTNDDLVEDVKSEVLKYLEKLHQDNAPEFIYFKTLFHLFEKYLTEKEEISLEDRSRIIVDTQIWNALFEFQKDGVKGAINKILNYNGCIIADSVGLGKTYEALAIIKYFELHNYRVLVLCPKKLKDNWTIYQATVNSLLNPFPQDRYGYTVLAHTDLSRDSGQSGDINLETFNWGNFDLVVIDESHNFRNNNRGRRDEEGNRISKSRYERLMEDIVQSGSKTKVLLISATPVNNDLRDLRNQIYFLTEADDHAYKYSLGIASIEGVLNAAQRTFNEWASNSRDRDTAVLLDRLSSAFFKLLDGLTIARSRKHIIQYYPKVIEELGGFPERLPPISVYSNIDAKNAFPSYDELNDRISEYELSLFNPSKYLFKEHAHQYELDSVLNFTQLQREHFLIGMMKVGFLKRLESSVHSFTLTLGRTIEKIHDLQDRIERFKTFREENPDLDFDDLEIEALEDEELRDSMEVGKKLVFNLAHLDVDWWMDDLNSDYERIRSLYEDAQRIIPDRDAKLHQLKQLIEKKVRKPTISEYDDPVSKERVKRESRKVLVFTAFADTASYLYENLKDWAKNVLGIHIAMVTGGTYENKTTLGRARYEHILTNFTPISKQRARLTAANLPQEEEIDLLIATDCISEGQNLQDCDYVINYDIHWNPVRIIQRFGRIDRIGSLFKEIQMVNFWPTKDLEKYISLKNRVEARMALVDLTATTYDNVLDQEEVLDLIEDDLSYRDKQLLRLKDEILDLEDFTETVTLTEFTLDDFRIELSRYLESNRRTLEESPLGLFTVVSNDPNLPSVRPGVIFCLRQRGDSDESNEVNPLQPYYLIYILKDGNVRYSFAQPKQILEILRGLCHDKRESIERLCDLFDKETDNGMEMTTYTSLLDSAVISIARTFKRRALRELGKSKEAKIPQLSSQVTEKTDFDLITWVVITDE